jgi:hypothetical protein
MTLQIILVIVIFMNDTGAEHFVNLTMVIVRV